MIFNSFYFRVGCAGLERTDFYKVSILGKGVMVHKRTDFYDSYLLWGRVWWSLKELLCQQYLTLGEGVVVMKQLIFNSFYFGQVW